MKSDEIRRERGAMNDENLRTLSPSEAREYGRRGGVRSGEVRRERKAIRQALEEALSMPCEVDGMELSNVEAIAASMVNEAKGGNVRAFVEIRNTVDGMPTQRIETAPAISEERRKEVEALLFGFGGNDDE